jgi:hypothetical protein
MKLTQPVPKAKKKVTAKPTGHYTEAIAQLRALSPVRMRDLEKQGKAFKAQAAMRSYFSRIAKLDGFEYKSLPAEDGLFWIIRVDAQ